MKAYNLKNIPFPACAHNCEALKHFGVCECESICPWKFDKNGNSVDLPIPSEKTQK
jgi:hypothetical protein